MQILTGISFAVVELVVVELPAEMMVVEVEAIVAVVFDPAAVARRICAVDPGKPVEIISVVVEKMFFGFVENWASPIAFEETAVGQMQIVAVVD